LFRPAADKNRIAVIGNIKGYPFIGAADDSVDVDIGHAVDHCGGEQPEPSGE
jgi:hypothetical protein